MQEEDAGGTQVDQVEVDQVTVDQVTVTVTVNGVPTDVPTVTSVAALVEAHGQEQRRVAVALNGDVVPRSEWGTTRIAGGDRVEVLAPTAGG